MHQVNSYYDLINRAVEQIVPELILLATVCVMFLTGPFLVSATGAARPGLRHRWGVLSLLALSAAGLAWTQTSNLEPGVGPFRSDQFLWFIRGISLVAGMLLTLLLWDHVDDGHSAEAYACLLSILAGVNLVALANDLVGLFLGLELVSLPTYVLLLIPWRGRSTSEAGIKYFLLSVFSSAILLYGFSLLFGLAGTTNLTAIADRAAAGCFSVQPVLFRIAMVLVIGGLSFRLAAVPFHFYAPDVFQGSTTSMAALLAFIPKVVGVAALLRLLPVCFGSAEPAHWVPTESIRVILGLVAGLTMFAGNLMAVRQTSLLRLLAYSSIAHAGYMLAGLAVGSNAGGASGIAAVLFYLAVYGIMTLGVFAVLVAAASDSAPLNSLNDLGGLSRAQPLAALLLAVCVFGLSGLPPTVGFLGKLNLLAATWSDGTFFGRSLAAVLALNAVIGAVYYLRLITLMYFEDPAARSVFLPSAEQPTAHPTAWIAGVACAVATLGLFVMPQWLWDAASLLKGH